MSNNEQKILKCIEQHPNIHVYEISRKTGISQPLVTYYIKKLKKDGKIIISEEIKTNSKSIIIRYKVA